MLVTFKGANDALRYCLHRHNTMVFTFTKFSSFCRQEHPAKFGTSSWFTPAHLSIYISNVFCTYIYFLTFKKNDNHVDRSLTCRLSAQKLFKNA